MLASAPSHLSLARFAAAFDLAFRGRAFDEILHWVLVGRRFAVAIVAIILFIVIVIIIISTSSGTRNRIRMYLVPLLSTRIRIQLEH